jgi:hypothetical protein
VSEPVLCPCPPCAIHFGGRRKIGLNSAPSPGLKPCGSIAAVDRTPAIFLPNESLRLVPFDAYMRMRAVCVFRRAARHVEPTMTVADIEHRIDRINR